MNISWILPSDLPLECIDIIISTNASGPSSTTDSSVIITKPSDDSADIIYTVSVAALDKAGRIGEQSETRCFSFQSENKALVCSCTIHIYHPVAPGLLEVHSDTMCSNAITMQWTVEVLGFCGLGLI